MPKTSDHPNPPSIPDAIFLESLFSAHWCNIWQLIAMDDLPIEAPLTFQVMTDGLAAHACCRALSQHISFLSVDAVCL